MTQEELGKSINSQINQNNDKIEKFLITNNFLLNSQVSELIEKNKQLQNQCPHSYKNGYCEYCYKEEE